MTAQECHESPRQQPVHNAIGSPIPHISRPMDDTLGTPSEQPLVRAVTAQLLPGEDAPANQQFQHLARSGGRDDNRQQFERSQRETIRALIERNPQLACFPILVFFCLVGFNAFVTVRGWIVVIDYFRRERAGEPCDEPLAAWLLVTLCQAVVTPMLQCLMATIGVFVSLNEQRVKLLQGTVKVVLPLVLLGVGFTSFVRSKTCAQSHPDLYAFVQFYLVYQAVILATQYVATCVMVSLLVYAFQQGWFDSHVEAADPRTLEMIKTVPYDPLLFSTEELADDDRPSGTCCCCMAEFADDCVIKQTPCNHYFHEECLSKWLKRARTCPLCRTDLDEAVTAVP